jgi:hypothetical protein
MNNEMAVKLSQRRHTNKEITTFVHYMLSFYGPKGLYSMNATQVEVLEALAQYLLEAKTPFEGDTVDRENVVEIIINNRR